MSTDLVARYAVLNSSGVLPIEQGGTGGNTQALARTGLGLGTAAVANLGGSGTGVPQCNATPTFSGSTFGHIRSDAGQGSLFLGGQSNSAFADLYQIVFRGLDSVGTLTDYATMRAVIVSPTDAAEAGALEWRTYGAGAQTKRMNLRLGLYMEGASGTDKGVGTVNAVGVYDDNVLLTCMPMQKGFREKGRVDLKKWDKLAPNGHHPAAHKFAAMLDEGFDPRDPANYIARAERDEALPGMPTLDEWKHGEISTGEMISRLWLAVEMLATAWVGAYKRGSDEARPTPA